MLGKLRSLGTIGSALFLAIACLFCAQSVIVHLDRIEHALELDHHPDALAGTVQCSADSADSCNSPDRAQPLAHTHLADTQTAALAAGMVSTPTFAAKNGAPTSSASRAGSGMSALAPERPPKA